MLRDALEAEKLPIQVAVMGCVVNGPGEAREADIGIAAGRGKGHLFIKGQVVRVVPEAEMVEALLDEARKLAEEGVEARLAAADVTAADLAEEARIELLDSQGDANRTEARRATVADVAGLRSESWVVSPGFRLIAHSVEAQGRPACQLSSVTPPHPEPSCAGHKPSSQPCGTIPPTPRRVSHRLLVRAGFIRQLMAGVYSLLPLGISGATQDPEDHRGGDGRHRRPGVPPSRHSIPAEMWQKSGRWDIMGDEMFRLVDRKGADLVLG